MRRSPLDGTLAAKLTGRQRYVSDLALDADLHAALVFVRGPGPVVVPPAERLRAQLPSGVLVFTAEDLPHAMSTAREPAGGPERALLCRDIAYPGRPVAFVLAESVARARAAARRAEEALIHGPAVGPRQGGEPVEVLVRARSSTSEAGLVTATHTVRVAPAAHSALESRAAVAVPGPGHRVEVHTNAQDAQAVAEQVRSGLGASGPEVVVVKHDEGGAFGGKQDPWFEPVLCWLAITHGTSVSLCHRPWEHLLAGPSRHQFEVTAELSVDPASLAVRRWRLAVTIHSGDGVHHVRSIANTVLDTFRSWLPSAAYEFVAEVVRSCRPPGTAYRGCGVPWAVAAFDVALRKAADLLGQPKERLLSVLVAGAAQAFRPALLRRLAAVPVRPGAVTGVSVAALATGLPGHPDDVTTCLLTLTPDRRVLIVTGNPDGGTGSHEGLRAYAGRLCGVPVDRVEVSVDPALADGGKRAQRSTYMSALALRAAYRTACARVGDLLASRFGAPVEIRGTAGGVLLAPRRGPELPATAWLSRLDLTMTAHGDATNTEAPLSSAACRVSVVDDDGLARVDALALTVDAGRIAVSHAAFGQAYGGIAWGIGSALVEGAAWSPRRTARAHGYVRSGDLPRTIDVRLLDRTDRHDRLPHGIGEVPMLPVVGAVVDALYQLRGERDNTALPELPEWVCR